jgi:hypothetical protein
MEASVDFILAESFLKVKDSKPIWSINNMLFVIIFLPKSVESGSFM